MNLELTTTIGQATMHKVHYMYVHNVHHVHKRARCINGFFFLISLKGTCCLGSGELVHENRLKTVCYKMRMVIKKNDLKVRRI